MAFYNSGIKRLINYFYDKRNIKNPSSHKTKLRDLISTRESIRNDEYKWRNNVTGKYKLKSNPTGDWGS